MRAAGEPLAHVLFLHGNAGRARAAVDVHEHPHYPFVPRAAVRDAHPSLRLVTRVRAPLLCMHGNREEIVPLLHGEALFEAAPEPKRMQVLAVVAHNECQSRSSTGFAE